MSTHLSPGTDVMKGIEKLVASVAWNLQFSNALASGHWSTVLSTVVVN